MAVAWYLYEHVMEGYRFLMQNYNGGDKVCIFGVSQAPGTTHAGVLNDDFIPRLFSWRVHCPSARRNVAQGLIKSRPSSVSGAVHADYVLALGRVTLNR